MEISEDQHKTSEISSTEESEICPISGKVKNGLNKDEEINKVENEYIAMEKTSSPNLSNNMSKNSDSVHNRFIEPNKDGNSRKERSECIFMEKLSSSPNPANERLANPSSEGKVVPSIIIDKVTEPDNGEKISEVETPADFETAIRATGFGKFNYLLLTVSIAAGLSTVFESTTMSYVFPAAQCDLNLSLRHKGLLNGVTYLGMVCTATLWGYICDTLGRKKLLVAGCLLDAIFCIMSATSQSFTILMTAKFLGGAVTSAPYAALSTYLSETHSSSHRARSQLIIGFAMSVGTLILPIMALAILPRKIEINVGGIVLKSWNIFLLICSLPSLTSGIAFIFLPESPKFLTTVGKNEKALRVFRRLYKMNTGKPEQTYPVKELINESKVNKTNDAGGLVTPGRTNIQALLEGWQQIKPICFPPHVKNLILVIVSQHLIMMGTNTVRLWLPQFFQAVIDYEDYYNQSAGLCVVLESFTEKSKNVSQECKVNLASTQVYTNAMIVAFATVAAFVTAGFVINMVGKKTLLYIIGLTSGTMAIALSFSQDNTTTVSLSSVLVGVATVGTNVILAIVVDLFPTTLRSMSVSLTMMFGRLGGSGGNILFPYLLEGGCLPSFVTIGCVLISCAVVAFFLPKTDFKSLK